MLRREYVKQDGRKLWLYGWTPQDDASLPEDDEPVHPAPHLRWHELRREWVVYAAHRQDRTFKPPAEHCPLCPSKPGQFPTEIPFTHYEVAVFENRFPAFTPDAPAPPALPVKTGRADGACEVVVYTDDHRGNLAALPERHVELLVRVWADRHRVLMARPDIQCVMPFENRGEEVGVTLHHPHGQIYSFPFIPPTVDILAQSFRDGFDLQAMIDRAGETYVIDREADALSIVPPFARFPFETWVMTRRSHPSLAACDDAEFAAFARVLKHAVGRLDTLFQRPMPYIAVLYSAPRGEEDRFQCHLQLLPFLRASGKLKYLAGCEQGAATFLVDMLPDAMADKLRAAIPAGQS